MKIQIPISEAVSLLLSKTGKTVALKIVNSNTVNVDYELKIKVPIFGHISKNIGVDITIERVEEEALYVQCSTAGGGINLILKGFFMALPTLSTSKTVETTDGSRLIINLNEIEEVRPILDQIRISNVTFDNDNVVIDFSLKKM